MFFFHVKFCSVPFLSKDNIRKHNINTKKKSPNVSSSSKNPPPPHSQSYCLYNFSPSSIQQHHRYFLCVHVNAEDRQLQQNP